MKSKRTQILSVAVLCVLFFILGGTAAWFLIKKNPTLTQAPLSSAQEELLVEASRLYMWFFSYANSTCGVFPRDGKEFLAYDWSADESMVYEISESDPKKKTEKWIYRKGELATTTDCQHNFLFASDGEKDGSAVVVLVDGTVILLDSKREVLRCGHAVNFLKNAPEPVQLYPRLVVVLGYERLSFYKNWTEEGVLNEASEFIKNTILETDDYKTMERFEAGIYKDAESSGKITGEFLLKKDAKGRWHFAKWKYTDRKSSESEPWGPETFKSREEAAGWFIENKLKPLLK